MQFLKLDSIKSKSFILDFFVLLTSILTFFLFVPSFHVGVTPSAFTFLDASIFFKMSIFFIIVFFLPLLLVSVIFHLIGLHAGSRCFVVFLLSWITISGFIFPLVRSDGMIEASEAIVNNQYLILVLSLSLVFSLIALTKLYFLPLVICMVIILTSIIPSAPGFFNILTKEKNTENTVGFTEVSTERNIFVVSFDGVPGTVARNVLEDNSDLAEVFKDFVFFANAVSQAPATHASIRSELYGNRNYHSLAASSEEVDSLLSPKNLLMNNITDSFTYGIYSTYNLNGKNKVGHLSFVSITEREEIRNHLYWIELLLSRIGTPNLPCALKEVGLYEVMIKCIASSNTMDNELSLRLENYVGHNWKRSYVRHIQDYVGIVDNLAAVKKGLSIRYMHFVHSHFPVDFDEKGAFRGDDPVWHRDNQNYQGLYNQCIGELSYFKMFIEKLKELDIYDKSLIVFKSDHGKPAIYYDFYPNALRINRHHLWGVDRYMPLLMIKDFASSQESISYNTDLVALADLAKTLCVAAQVANVDCSNFPGLNLLGTYSLSDCPKFYIETVASPISTYKFDTHKTFELERNKRRFYEILETSALVDLSLDSKSMSNPKLKLSQPVSFAADGNISDFLGSGWSVQGNDMRWTDGPQAKLAFRLQERPSENLLLRLKASAHLGGGLPCQKIDVIVNGQQVTTWQVSGLAWYEAEIPAITTGNDCLLEVVFNISNPISPLEVGVSKDPRKLGIAARALIIDKKVSDDK